MKKDLPGFFVARTPIKEAERKGKQSKVLDRRCPS
jgi:hypothetical protein